MGGQLHVCGGTDGVQYLSGVERYDNAVGTWEALRSMLTRRVASGVAVVAGQIHICGGACRGGHHMGENPPLSSVERFDPSKGTWEYVPSMHTRRTNVAATTLSG